MPGINSNGYNQPTDSELDAWEDIITDIQEDSPDLSSLQDQLDKLKLVIRSAELPSFQFDTQTLNQYNRKRVIQTRANFQPVTITFIDTRDNKWQNVFKEYLNYYYKFNYILIS